MKPARSYLVCATPRSGSTLLCEALKSTGVAGRPEEYFEALRQSGRPRRPQEYFPGVDDPSIADHLGEYARSDERRHELWSREDYEPYFEWAIERGTTENGIFGAKLMWGYFGDFVSLLREVPRFHQLELPELFQAAFPDLTFIRVNRANRLRQAASLWKAVQTATWRKDESASQKRADDERRPQLRFHYRAIDHLLNQILAEEAFWDAFFERCDIDPLVINYERFINNSTKTIVGILEELGVEPPAGWSFEPALHRQSDEINDDWVRRFGELKVSQQPWAAPAVEAPH